MNKKAREKALFMCLSDKALTQNLVVMEKWEQNSKSKALAGVLARLPLEKKKVLIALSREEKSLTRAARNLVRVATIGAAHLNVEDILKAKVLVVSKEGIGEIEKTHAGK